MLNVHLLLNTGLVTVVSVLAASAFLSSLFLVEITIQFVCK